MRLTLAILFLLAWIAPSVQAQDVIFRLRASDGSLLMEMDANGDMTTTGRLSLGTETCTAATPTVVGQICVDTSESFNSLHVATGTGAGEFEEVVIAGVTLPFGGVHLSTSNAAETTIDTVDIFKTVAGTCSADSLNQFTASGCELTFTDDEPHTTFVSCAVSLTAAGNNKIFHLRIVKNDSPDEAEAQDHSFPIKLATGGDVTNIVITRELDLVDNDTIEVYIANTTDITNVTVQSMGCSARAM